MDRFEDPDQYTPGGYHPVDIGDQLHNGRYRIIHRLGHGGFSTTWLAVNQHYDDAGLPNAKHSRYVAVKIAIANRKNDEAAMLRWLELGPGGHFIVSLLDEFEITGPNGPHHCIVTELLGPSIRDVKRCSQLHYTRLPAPIGRRAKAVAYLHSHGIVHAGRLSAAHV
jgi:serine/threonine-protein kinase SRPK3